MEEEMAISMKNKTLENPRKIPSISSHSIANFPTWKLYENPFYLLKQTQDQKQKQHQDSKHKKQIHHLHLPISARKIAASFWDLTFVKPLMESELEKARSQILELKTKLEYEQIASKKATAMNKKLSRELSQERKGREALESVCQELAKELSSYKGEANRVKKEIEEERKMLRVAEILREERVQMKLSEAKYIMEATLSELEATKQGKSEDNNGNSTAIESCSREESNSVLTEKCMSNSDNNGGSNSIEIQRRASQEAINPHIRRGIKGFVEFPRVVRAIGSKNNKVSGTEIYWKQFMTKQNRSKD